MYSQFYSISGGCTLLLYPEDTPCHDDRGAHNMGDCNSGIENNTNDDDDDNNNNKLIFLWHS
jgi:hypothetical protein